MHKQAIILHSERIDRKEEGKRGRGQSLFQRIRTMADERGENAGSRFFSLSLFFLKNLFLSLFLTFFLSLEYANLASRWRCEDSHPRNIKAGYCAHQRNTVRITVMQPSVNITVLGVVYLRWRLTYFTYLLYFYLEWYTFFKFYLCLFCVSFAECTVARRKKNI